MKARTQNESAYERANVLAAKRVMANVQAAGGEDCQLVKWARQTLEPGRTEQQEQSQDEV